MCLESSFPKARKYTLEMLDLEPFWRSYELSKFHMELIIEPFTNYIKLITKLYILDDIKGLINSNWDKYYSVGNIFLKAIR